MSKNDTTPTTPEKPKMQREWYTTAEAAEALGLSAASVRHAVMRGALAVQQVHGRLNAISAEEVERYRAEHLGGKGWDKRRDPASAPSAGALASRRYRERKRAEAQAEPPAEGEASKDGTTE